MTTSFSGANLSFYGTGSPGDPSPVTGTGSCGLTALDPNFFAAVTTSLMQSHNVCGMCAQITCPQCSGRTVIAEIIDTCPTCDNTPDHGSINVSLQTMAALLGGTSNAQNAGVVRNASWQLIACPPTLGLTGSPSSTATASSSASPSPSGGAIVPGESVSKGPPTAAIAGGVVGGLLALALIAFFVYKRRNNTGPAKPSAPAMIVSDQTDPQFFDAPRTPPTNDTIELTHSPSVVVVPLETIASSASLDSRTGSTHAAFLTSTTAVNSLHLYPLETGGAKVSPPLLSALLEKAVLSENESRRGSIASSAVGHPHFASMDKKGLDTRPTQLFEGMAEVAATTVSGSKGMEAGAGFKGVQPGLWSVEHVCAWLGSMNYSEEVVDKFRDKGCTGQDLKNMSVSDDNCFEVLTSQYLIPGLGMRFGLAQQIRGLFAVSASVGSAEDLGESPPAYFPL
ncbi:hypothetical protein HDU98_006682 [Podochytrium sp. JEL0797]|nr:hypothetical protein HDU98_006682 [Podochytrium sp. JEL0797]